MIAKIEFVLDQMLERLPLSEMSVEIIVDPGKKVSAEKVKKELEHGLKKYLTGKEKRKYEIEVEENKNILRIFCVYFDTKNKEEIKKIREKSQLKFWGT